MEIRTRVLQTIELSLRIPKEQLSERLAVGEHPHWDSLGHALLLTALEQEFACRFDIDETLEMETVEAIIEILTERFR